jgi:hypothetical protein
MLIKQHTTITMGVEKYMFLVVQRWLVKVLTFFPGVHMVYVPAGYQSNHPVAGLLPGNSFFLIRTTRYVEGIPDLWAMATSLPRSKTRLSGRVSWMRQRNCAIARILYLADFKIVRILNIVPDIKGESKREMQDT